MMLMNSMFGALLFAGGMFLGMLLFQEVGRRIGISRKENRPEDIGIGVGAMQAGVFALLGLLIAFTFQGASARFDTRPASGAAKQPGAQDTARCYVRRGSPDPADGKTAGLPSVSCSPNLCRYTQHHSVHRQCCAWNSGDLRSGACGAVRRPATTRRRPATTCSVDCRNGESN
jgi:hypothetical protein